MGRTGKKSNIKKREIIEKWGKLKTRGSNLHLPWKGINDFGDGEFYGFASISNKKRKFKKIYRKEYKVTNLISRPMLGGN